MKAVKVVLLLGFMLNFLLSAVSFAEEKILFSYEDGTTQGWEIPDWALEKEDHVAEALEISEKYALDEKKSLEIITNFPGGRWTGVYIEIQEYFDWTPYGAISVPIYLPADAPEGLKAKIILTVGDSWEWVEMSRAIPLVPGKWTVITADLKPGSADWKKAVNSDAFRQDVRKFGIRIESNNKPAYKGSIYIDKISLNE
ncbi:MAG: hypothetical protein AB1755_02210 [Candidatus Omnitrophota bacterium]